MTKISLQWIGSALMAAAPALAGATSSESSAKVDYVNGAPGRIFLRWSGADAQEWYDALSVKEYEHNGCFNIQSCTQPFFRKEVLAPRSSAQEPVPIASFNCDRALKREWYRCEIVARLQSELPLGAPLDQRSVDLTKDALLQLNRHQEWSSADSRIRIYCSSNIGCVVEVTHIDP